MGGNTPVDEVASAGSAGSADRVITVDDDSADVLTLGIAVKFL